MFLREFLLRDRSRAAALLWITGRGEHRTFIEDMPDRTDILNGPFWNFIGSGSFLNIQQALLTSVGLCGRCHGHAFARKTSHEQKDLSIEVLVSLFRSQTEHNGLLTHATMSLVHLKMHYHRHHQQTVGPALHFEFKHLRKRSHSQLPPLYSWEKVLTYAQEMIEYSRRANQRGLSNDEWTQLLSTISTLELCVRMLRDRFERSHLSTSPPPDALCSPVSFTKQSPRETHKRVDTETFQQQTRIQQPHYQHLEDPGQQQQPYSPSLEPSQLSPTFGIIHDRRCAECGATETPEWRRGHNGKILCNACGIRFRRRNKRVKQLESQRIRDRTSIKAILN